MNYEALRREKDAYFKMSEDAPLTEAQQLTFKGLNYYPVNPQLDLVVDVELVEQDQEILITTTTNELRRYQRYGRFTFQVNGEAVTLTIYEAPHGYFLPFVDANSGVETYPAGRYLEPEPLSETRFRVDFNLAYNPYCAYSEGWSCPITPKENRVNVAIRAGEKNPTA